MFNPKKELDMITKIKQPNSALQITPLVSECRAALPTWEAAIHLNRQQQTLRLWACLENGPIRPIRCNRRLAWPTAEIKKLMGVTS